ncbi:MAG: C4-dicarboxylate ABC transporter, partial [Rubrivivax sp.]|nr:C4-dicarboxylate ABC transporter [Rubrivivax sp.]
MFKRKSEDVATVDVNKLVTDTDMGARNPGPFMSRVLLAVALAWSLFQLWIASPLPFVFGVFVLNDTESRSIHLAFAVFLAFLSYPAFKRSPSDRIPVTDWILAVAATFCAAYLFVFYREIATRPGQPSQMDIATAAVGVVLLLEATRRVLGLPMVVVAVVFLIYTFAGPYMPDMIAHKGSSLARVASHQWLTTEGVFGVALG